MKILYTFILIASTILSANAQANWSAVLPAKFPTNASGQIHGISRVSQMKWHPTNPNKMYAVSARGGLFISQDAGANWAVTPGTDFMPYSRLASVCIDYTNDQILYLGTGDHDYYYTGTGVWKSTDGGVTFSQTGLKINLVVDMIMDPLDHNILVAVTNAGIYKTYNGGTSWTAKSSTSIQFDDLKKKENASSRVLFAATTGSDLYRSTDFGETWTQITSGIYIPAGFTSGAGCRIAVTPADSNVVYFAMVVKGGTIFKSTDGGTNFTVMKDVIPDYLTYYSNLSTSSTQGDYNFGIGADRTNANILYLVAHNVWKSTNSGATWTQLTNWYERVHTDMHQISISPYNSSQVWNMNDGGVWLSTDGGNNWVPKSDGIYGYEIYHGNCSPTRRDMFSIGTQDNGELYANTLGWFTNRGGDWGSQCAFDYRTNSAMVYYYNRNKRRLVTGSEATYGLPAAITVLQGIAFNRSSADLAFVADTLICRTTNLTATTPTWTQIANLGKKIMDIHSSVNDANRLYIVTSDGMIYVSTNALAATPTFVSYTLPNPTNNAASITSVKNFPNTVYVTCNTKVYCSTDNGATWVNITSNLPSVNHTKILTDEYATNELVMIASDNTVYYKVGTALTWTLFNTNLPSRTTVVDMSIFNDNTTNTSLRFSTYGRGVWETPITSLRTLTANFAALDTNPCVGTPVQFSDMSTGGVTSRTWTFTGGTPSSSTAAQPLVTYAVPGIYNVSLSVTNGVNTSPITKSTYITTYGGALPVAEGFEGSTNPPSGWKNVDNGTAGYLWTKVSTAGGFGGSTYSMMFDNYSWNIPGQKDELQVRRLDLTGYSTVNLTFDVAYQVFSGYSDSLAVLVSTDCGNTFTRVYFKGGTTLSTAGSGSNNFVPTAAQWRTETINLNSYIGQSSVIVEFQNVANFGNKLYIDNINLVGTYSTLTMNLKAIIEGFHLGGGMMNAVVNPGGQPLNCDSVTVEMREANSPYTLKYSIKTILKTDGSITFNCPGTLYNTACYFVIKHRNSLETWSAAPQLLNGPTYTYDFTTGISKSYGNNMVLNGGKYCLFSGDINQDGVIESTDFGDVENKSQLFLFGYQVDDLTGDNLVESSDYGLIENNSQLFLFSQRP
ncbi:MAG: choice-of-anchor J domain-containing protein [Bacteroidetes bacterium]|nr:choice-of-anchor J domain-containing protein [Bacteroidota bacterium]